MSAAATIESLVPGIAEIAPLEAAIPDTETPHFFGHIVHALADAWVNNGCGPGVQTHNDKPIDFGKAGLNETSLADLLSARVEHLR